jgi:hypothetical protein
MSSIGYVRQFKLRVLHMTLFLSELTKNPNIMGKMKQLDS